MVRLEAKKAERAHVTASGDKRLQLYTGALIVSMLLYLVVYGTSGVLFIFVTLVVMLLTGAWLNNGLLLQIGVASMVILTIFDPLILGTVNDGRPLAATLSASPTWPQMLVALFGSRVLSCHQTLVFRHFWKNPLGNGTNVSIQSFPAALALGAFLIMLLYTLVPSSVSVSAPATTSIIVSAIRGETIIHTLILFLFFVILAFIAEAALQHWSDRQALGYIRERLKQEPSRSSSDIRKVLVRHFDAIGHRRITHLLTGALDLGQGEAPDRPQLAMLSYDAFHRASRHFIRTLIPFLTLLGFLGTVIGLATAVSELPGDLTPVQGGIDVSGSLAGLAVKFETTLLGLIATMVSSLLLNLLEKQEHQLAAECLLVAHEENLTPL